MNSKEKELITKAINERISTMKCPMCGNSSFLFVDGYMLQKSQRQLYLDSQLDHILPTVMIVCANCGFVSQHALGTMGLLEDLLKAGTQDYNAEKGKKDDKK